MATKYNDEKRELLAFIDAIISILEQQEDNRLADIDTLNLSVNPFELLLSVIQKFVSLEEMTYWLSKTLTVILPIIEVGVKGVLLSNLKGKIDCNIDPTIPEYMRRSSILIKEGVDDQDERGINIFVPSIDFKNMLSVSPLSKEGQSMYFGTKVYYTYNHDDYVIEDGKKHKRKFLSYDDAVKNATKNNIPVSFIKEDGEVSSVYELVRAQDFNAFLWFVMNKAKFIVNGKEIPNNQTVFDCFETDENISGESTASYSPGYLISNDSYNNLLCIKMKADVISNEIKQYSNVMDKMQVANLQIVSDAFSSKEIKYQFVSVSNQLNGCNWYVNSKNYLNYLVSSKDRSSRDYNKDKAICHIKYLNSNTTSKAYGNVHSNCFNFTILPKPSIIYPKIGLSSEECSGATYDVVHSNLSFRKKILLNKNGQIDKNGKYSVNLNNYTVNGFEKFSMGLKGRKLDGEEIVEVVKEPTFKEDGTCTEHGIINYNYYLYKVVDIYNKSEENYYVAYKTSDKTLSIVKENNDNYNSVNLPSNYLYECYKQTTVYEFNFDYVMGMRLFDPEVVASQLIENVLNMSFNISANLNINDMFYQQKIKETVKKIVESTDYTVADCFYQFSNAKYDEMLRKAEEKRSKSQEFGASSDENISFDPSEILEMLSDFDDDAELVENIDVIKNSFEFASELLSSGVNDEDAYAFKVEFINNLIISLVYVVVDSLMSPKIIMLFQINKHLLGDLSENYNFETFLESISDLLVSIVKEVRDMILKQILDWAMEILRKLKDKLVNALVKEQYMYYVRLMQQLIKACRINRNASEIENVDYADIDEITTEQPNEEC